MRLYKPDVSESVLENICLYASHFPADFAMTLFTDMSRIEGIRAKLAKTRVFQQWLAKNGRTL